MRKYQKLSLTAFALLAVGMVVAAITTNYFVEVYESEFVTSLRKKFTSFNEQAKQDRLYLQTDKTLYSPGETIWFTAYVRDEQTLKPSENSDILHVEFITPKGTTAKHYKLVAKNGAAQGDFDLSGMVGGIYKIKAYTQWQQNADSALLFEKEITVQSVVMPRLKMKLDFEKKVYGKGDEVVAKLELNTNANQPLANTKVKFSSMLAGKELEVKSITTDAEGKAQLKFVLPKDLNTIDGLVNAMIDFEGSTESISRSVPIVLNKIKVEFFPEGGDMVSSIEGKVAFRATNEFDKPADIEGIVVNSKGQFVTDLSSYHFGMGSFNLTPASGEKYKVRITKPVGILDEFELPEALTVGYTLGVKENSAGNIQLKVNSWQQEELSLVAQTRGKIYFAKSFKAQKGNNLLSLSTKDFPIGVSQLTLFDSKGIARCERLAFVSNNKQLKISVTTDKKQYQPREKVNMTIAVTDQNGLPIPGNFSMSVVDDNQLTFADDKQGNILSKILLEPDLKEKVEEANFYFNSKEEKATQALDYLLMTSGWRHYTWKQIQNQDLPAVKYMAEKATLGGTVLDAYTGKPVSGALLKFKNTNKTAWTDKDGKFLLSRFDITKDNQLEIDANGFDTQLQTVVAYGKDNYYYLYDGRYKNVREEMFMADDVMMAPMGAVEVAAGGMAEERRTVANNKVEQKKFKGAKNGEVDRNENGLQAQGEIKDLEKLPAPPDVIDKPIDQQNDPNATGVVTDESKIGDIRLAGLLKADKDAEAGNQIVFYRAKEFPKKKYQATDTVRNDFASTVYWNGNIETDRWGRAKVEFVTNDLISTFKSTIEGFGDDGSIGHAEQTFSTELPFSMDVKLPVEVVAGDKMMIPVFLKNTTDEEINGKMIVVSPKQLLVDLKTKDIVIPAKDSKLIYLQATASSEIGTGRLEIKFESARYNDAFNREVSVVAKGFPANVSLSGQDLDKQFVISTTNVVPGSLKATFTAYPNVMSDLMSGIDAILREPYGCFEQTSSSNYPNIMALSYLQNTKTSDPAIEAKAKQLLASGYNKLVAFETKENGYEWFGAAPAHEALSAYGLMEFVDMKKVYAQVDDKMIERTVKLLLEKRDGNGGFKKNPRALDSFGAADADITNCYIVYAMSEAGKGSLIEKEINAAYKEAKKSNDPYMLALMANTMFNINDKQRGEELLDILTNGRQEAGFWTGKRHSITRSTGDALKIETTSLVVLAMMKSNETDMNTLTGAIKFLVGQRSGYGMFGSTQSTILALKALSKYAEFSKKTDEAGTIEVLINGVVVATKDFAKGERNNVEIAGLEKYLAQGKQQIEVRFKGCKNALPYSMNVSYNTTLPESSKQCAVSLTTKLGAKQVRVGETLRLSATLKNKTNEGQPMTMAIIGLPAGFSAQPWQLKEMQEKGVIDFYEIIGNNVACYYRDLAPGEEKQINFDLKAEIAGEYDAPASSAYLYYTNEHKDWVGLDRVFVNP
ncbi:MAG: MG2 domain-containing protein [Chitinophagales bacterium]